MPGALRQRDVQVGQHIGISPGAVPRFLERFEDTFNRLGKAETILAAAAAHHRLAWIHPFLDGNGRVVRLMSHATLLEMLDTGAVWSVSRGLARNVEAYKSHLAACDLPRRNDLDGRGALSEEALAEFTGFFLQTCFDQVAFMERLVQPAQLRTRILLWAEEEIRMGHLMPKTALLLDALLYRGEIPRGELAGILDVGDRHARRIAATLAEKDVITSDGPYGPIRLAFPAALASRWMPGLFPEKTS
jgi:Fic family protein